MGIRDLLNRLEDAEQRFVGTPFLAPIAGARKVRVRIAGVVCELAVTAGLPRDFRGWAVLRSSSTSRAEFVRPAGLGEIAAYLGLFPKVRLLLVQREADRWLCVAARRGDTRFRLEGLVPVLLPEQGLERFETVLARFDGHLFWHERRDPAADPSIAAYLRGELGRRGADRLPPAPESLHRRGLCPEEREAYALARAQAIEAERDQVEVRLEQALAHGGAELRSYAERGDTYVVTYSVDGRPHVSTVRRDDLTVLTAGICLAGEDQKFDLASLVGVLREGRREDFDD